MDRQVKNLLAEEQWHDERIAAREIVLSTSLTETVKWNQLCYCYNGQNVLIFAGFKAFCALGFFKGVLLADPDGILHQHGKDSQSSRSLILPSAAEMADFAPVIRGFIDQAIAVEEAGLKVDFKAKRELVYPDALAAKIASDPAYAAAFEALTPGRKRGYVIHIEAAKQEATRIARVEKLVGYVMAGKGFQGR